MSKRVVGTCGNCGGAVTVPVVFLSVVPPTPQCDSCGSRPANAFGPVVKMEPARPRGGDGLGRLMDHLGRWR